jgi:hypothetical protein
MSTNGKLYECFEPQERFTLTLQALARRDEAEAERLAGSCPRERYTQRDVRFTGRMDTALHIMSIAVVDLRCLGGKLQTLEWAIGGARLMVHGRRAVREGPVADGLLQAATGAAFP